MERAHGFNVGVDAHLDPKPNGTSLYVEWDGVIDIFPFNRVQGEPYLAGRCGHRPLHSVWGAFHSTGRVKPAGFRAAGSRPYGGVPFIGGRE